MTDRPASSTDPSAAYRLPYTVEPQRYQIRLVPDLDAATFDGHVRIEAIAHEAVTTIALHGAELAVTDAAVEVDGIAEAGVSEKVDDHLTASAVMAKDHQGIVGRQVVDARWDLRHRNMQGAFQLADV